MSLLDELIDGAREDFELRRRHTSLRELQEQALALGPAPSMLSALTSGETPRVIAEIKRASPSAGSLAGNLDAAATAAAYAGAGATAISVLTEERRFRGSLDDLRAVADAVGIPTLRKDFIVDDYQIWEARAYGASAVLLIVAALSATVLVQMIETARQAGLHALVEVHSEDELAVAAGCGAQIIGVNARDLRTFNVDLEVCERLAEHAPSSVTLVAESGIQNRADIERLQQAGYSAFLVGSVLVQASDPGAKLRELRGA